MDTNTKIPKVGFYPDMKGGRHNYWYNGKRMYGITTVLGKWDKGGLIQWASNQAIDYVKKKVTKPNGNLESLDVLENLFFILEEARTAHAKKRDKAGEAGTDTHAIVERWIKSCIEAGSWISNGSKHRQVKNFKEWAIENKVKFLSSEKVLHSVKMFTVGTADFTC